MSTEHVGRYRAAPPILPDGTFVPPLTDNQGRLIVSVAPMEVPTLAQLALTPGGGMVFVDEVQSWYITALGPLVADGVIVVANVAGTFWVHQGEELVIHPVGGGADDQLRFITWGNAAANHGKTLVATDGLFLFNHDPGIDPAAQMVSGFDFRGSPDVTIQTLLSPLGTFATAAFVALEGAPVGANYLTTVAAARGDTQITVAAPGPSPIGSLISIGDANNGNRASGHLVTNVVGAVMTLDRPLPRDYPVGSVVQRFASFPKDIHLDGNGTLLTGTGKRFVEIVFGQECIVERFRFDNSAGIPNDLLFSYDVGGKGCVLRNLSGSCGPGSATLGCFALESNDSGGLIENCEGNADGSQQSIILYDCSDCSVLGGASYGASGSNVLLTSDFVVQDASTRGCIACRVVDHTSLGSAGGGVRVENGSIDCEIVNVAAEKCSVGIQIGDGLTTVRNTKLVDVNARFNTTIGAAFATPCPGIQVKNIDLTGNGTSAATGTGILAGEYFELDGLRSDSGNNVNLILSSGGGDWEGINAAAAPTPAINGWIQCNGAGVRYSIRRSRLSMTGAANSSAVQTAGKLSIDTTVIAVAGGFSTGVFTQPGGSLRIGRDNDWSGAATPYGANGGGDFSQNQVVLGAAPVAVAFADLKATDRIAGELQALGGTGVGGFPIIVRTPGTGFTAAQPVAGDTSTWNLFVES